MYVKYVSGTKTNLYELKQRNGNGSGMGRNCGTNQPTFLDYDLNNDKKITEKEFQDALSKRMARLVAQGKLLKNAGNGPAFNDIDTSKNGTISLDEYQQHQNQQINSANKYKCLM